MDDKKSLNFEDLEECNMDIIENLPWAQDMWQFLNNGLQKSFLNWCKYVIGLTKDPKKIDQWVQTYKTEFEATMCELACDMAILNDKVVSKVEILLKRFQHVCTELRIEMPGVGDQKLCLYEEIDELDLKINEYKAQLDARKAEIKKLIDKQSEICKCLGKPTRFISISPLPTAEQIENVQKYIEKMECEKYEREEKFIELKGEILNIISELRYEPSSEFEFQLISSDDSKMMITDIEMRELNKFHDKLIIRKEEMKADISEKWAKIETLWVRLDVDLIERGCVRDNTEGNICDELERLNEELKRLEYVKKENIKTFIDKCKIELRELWDKCHVINEQEDFEYFHSDCYTEDLLELFEIEITKWKKYYEDNKNLLKLVDEYNSCWQKIAALDEKANGPKRFHNRGGNLLQEEKMRNNLKKKIPHLEQELQLLSDNYTNKTGLIFTTRGKDISNLISGLYKEREEDRKQKLSARKQQRDKTMLTPCKSSMQLFPGSSTTDLRQIGVSSVSKRKIFTTPKTEVKKKPRMESRMVMSDTKRRLKVTAGSVANKRKSLEKSIRRRRSNNKSNKENTDEYATSNYNSFLLDLTNKSIKTRSTLDLDAINKKPPHRTPIKSSIPQIIINSPITQRTKRIGTPHNVRQVSSSSTKPSTPRSPRTPRVFGVLSTARSNTRLHF